MVTSIDEINAAVEVAASGLTQMTTIKLPENGLQDGCITSYWLVRAKLQSSPKKKSANTDTISNCTIKWNEMAQTTSFHLVFKPQTGFYHLWKTEWRLMVKHNWGEGFISTVVFSGPPVMFVWGVNIPVLLLSGAVMLLLFSSSPLWAFSLVSLEGGLVTPGILGRPRGGVLATGELRHSSRNFRS